MQQKIYYVTEIPQCNQMHGKVYSLHVNAPPALLTSQIYLAYQVAYNAQALHVTLNLSFRNP